MKYPKMLYKGEPKYTDSAKLRDDLTNKIIKTIVVTDDGQEDSKRKEGYVDLSDLMEKPKKTLTLPEKNHGGINAQ